MRCYCIFFLVVGLLTANLAFSQNLTVEITPLFNPTIIPQQGGSCSYQLGITNHNPTPQQGTLWCVLTAPDGEQQLSVQPWTAGIAAGQTLHRSFTETLLAASLAGNYNMTANIGIYPNTVWDSDQFIFSKVLAPEWVARYNGSLNSYDIATSIATDGNGNVYVTGRSRESGVYYDYATIKYNNSGNQIWVAHYNGPANTTDAANSIAVDGDGCVYVTGYSYGIGTNNDFATIKYDASGNQLWVMRYSGPGNNEDRALSLVLDRYSNIYVTGYSVGSGTGKDFATVKYDASGNQLWVACYNGPGNDSDEALSLAADAFGNIYVTGYSVGNGTGDDYATLKYDVNGIQQWVARYSAPGNSSDRAKDITVDNSGNVYVTGYSSGDYFTIKYDTNGNQLWLSRYDGPANHTDQAYALAVDSFGNVYVTGSSYGNGTSDDFATVKYNSDGNQLWVTRFNSAWDNLDQAYSITLDSFNNVCVAGRGFDANYLTIKYDGNGNQIWLAYYDGPGNSEDAVASLALDSFDNVYVTGYSCWSSTNFDYATVKYSYEAWVGIKSTIFGAPLPTEYRLQQNYPNPFNPTTTISYQLPTKSQVTLEVFDVSGRLVTTLIDGWRQAGSHEVTYDASGLAAGVYVCRLVAGDYMGVRKLILLK